MEGSFSGRSYRAAPMRRCRYAFIADPWTDFARIYDDRYYAGQGRRPAGRLRLRARAPAAHRPPLRVARHHPPGRRALLGGLDGVRWLDFGAATAAWSATCRDHSGATACWALRRARSQREPGRLGSRSSPPLSSPGDEGELRRGDRDRGARAHARPRRRARGSVGSCVPEACCCSPPATPRPTRRRLARWPYVIPEIHISFFEPATLDPCALAGGLRTGAMPPAGGV